LIEKVFYNFVKVIVASPHRLPKLPESTLRKQARPNNGSLFCSHHTCAWGAQIIAWAFLGLSQFLGKGAAPPPPVHINAFISPKPLLPTGYPIQAHCAILFISYLRAARKNTFSFALLIYPPYKLQSGHKNIKRHQWGKNDLNKQD
jgi:hypothetical protein